MEAVAYLRYCRISPRKVQIVLDQIRNKPVNYAMAVLQNTPKAACEPLEKLLKSAIANGENNNGMSRDAMYVAKCFVTPGPTMKRVQPMDHGKAFRILKRSSHITIVLKEKD